MISERKKNLLAIIIKEYLKSVQPVSSGLIVEKYKLDISPATVRNEMMELEDDGYIFQPHTSSGRIPTEKAYKEFLTEDLKNPRSLKESELKSLDSVFAFDEASFKATAKLIAEISGASIFWAFHKNDLYYTGLTNLFSQPEFRQVDTICDVSGAIDRLEEIIVDNFEKFSDGEQVFIGSDNPFGVFLGAVMLKYRFKQQTGVFGILGPLRMDYSRNLSFVKYLKDKFQSIL